jgi:Rod binding domain-containing protein
MGIGPGLGSLVAQTSIQQSMEDRMMSGVKQTKNASDSAKIEKGAREFEAVLVGSWLQQAEASFATVPGAEEDQDAGGQQMMSLGVQSLATSMAAGGGIGIGKMIAKAMHAAADKAEAQPGVASPLAGGAPVSGNAPAADSSIVTGASSTPPLATEVRRGRIEGHSEKLH